MDYEDSAALEQEFEAPVHHESAKEQSTLVFMKKYLLLIRVFLCILVVANNTVLITAICKFKILQTRSNHIILNFAIVSSSFSVICVFENLSVYFPDIKYLYIFTIVSLILTYLILTSGNLALFLGIDWFIFATYTNFFSKYQKKFKWGLAACYVLPLIILPSFLATIKYFAINLTVFIIYIICILIITAVNMAKQNRNYTQESLKCAYTLTLSNIYFMMWFPGLFFETAFIYAQKFSAFKNTEVLFLLQVLFLVAFVAPVAMTFILIRRNENFKISYDAMFKKSVQAYEHEENNINE